MNLLKSQMKFLNIIKIKKLINFELKKKLNLNKNYINIINVKL